MSIDWHGPLAPSEDTEPGPAPTGAVVRPALLAGEEHESPDPSIFRGAD
ncbi:hypothetical protein [Streptomyces sp. NPDC052225]